MATSGQLDPLTIAAVFLVVFAGVYAGDQLRDGELLPADTTTGTEDHLRAAVWSEIDDRRAARGLDPMPRDRFVRGIAQDTTDAIVARQPVNGTASSGVTVDTTGLPNQRLFCSRVAAAVPVANGSAPARTAASVADALEAADAQILYRSRARFRAGMGIAVHDGTVYAVYRSCEMVDT